MPLNYRKKATLLGKFSKRRRAIILLCAGTSAGAPLLTYKRNTFYAMNTMGILTVRLTEEEERVLARRSRQARMKRATYVRMLIREEPFASSADVLVDAAKRMGDVRLRVSRK